MSNYKERSRSKRHIGPFMIGVGVVGGMLQIAIFETNYS